MCKDLLSGKCVTYFQPLSSRYGNYLESELQKLRKDQWANRSDEYKLQCSEDEKRRWDEWSDENKLQCSEDGKRRWGKRSDENKLDWSENKQKWWDDQSEEYKQEWSDKNEQRQRKHDLQKLSSG